MGNIVEIRNGEDEIIGQAVHSLLCHAYFSRIAAKYNPIFQGSGGMFLEGDRLNKEMKRVYERSTPWDEIVVLVFMNDKNHFKKDDIPYFERAIAEYPDDFHQGPKRVLTKMLDLLKTYGELKTEYVGVSMGGGPIIKP